MCSLLHSKLVGWGSSPCQFERTYPLLLGLVGTPIDCLVKLIPQRYGRLDIMHFGGCSVGLHFAGVTALLPGGWVSSCVRIMHEHAPFLGLSMSL